MATKNNPGPYDCYAALDPDEPYFVLVAHDPMAPSLVRSWAQTRQQQVEMGLKPVEDLAKVTEARACATAMEQWRAARVDAELGRQNAAVKGLTPVMEVPSRNQPVPDDVEPAPAVSSAETNDTPAASAPSNP
jgi:hypothetical protein